MVRRGTEHPNVVTQLLDGLLVVEAFRALSEHSLLGSEECLNLVQYLLLDVVVGEQDAQLVGLGLLFELGVEDLLLLVEVTRKVELVRDLFTILLLMDFLVFLELVHDQTLDCLLLLAHACHSLLNMGVLHFVFPQSEDEIHTQLLNPLEDIYVCLVGLLWLLTLCCEFLSHPREEIDARLVLESAAHCVEAVEIALSKLDD